MAMNRQGGFADLFVIMAVTLIFLVVFAIFIYIAGETKDRLHSSLEKISFVDANGGNMTETIDDTFGKVSQSYSNLPWIMVMLIVGMMLSVFIGSWMVTTHPIVFFPLIIITIIAVFVAVGLSNAYEQVIAKDTLEEQFGLFTGGNFFFLNLPVFIAVIGGVGMIIMLIRWAKREEYYG